MAEIKVMRTPAETALAKAFEAAKGKRTADAFLREEAFRLFSERGLPHRRVEEFKYTDLRALMRDAAPPAQAPSVELARTALAGALGFGEIAGAARLAFVNGHFAPEGSTLKGLPAAVEAVSLNDALGLSHPLLEALSPVPLARENPIYQLNSAFVSDGALIRVAEGAAVEEVLHLQFVHAGETPSSSAPRVLIVLEAGASLTVLESHEGPDGIAFQPNGVVEVVLGEGARLAHVRLNREGDRTLALSTLAVRLGARSLFETVNVVAGPAASRHQVYLAFIGEHAEARVNGATMLKGDQHADTTLVIDHAGPHGVSRELFKTVIDDEATGVFQGKIIVRPEAQKTDGRMMSAALLLGEGGTMNNKPELEIFADDVQCGHGATSGALDEELLFYLMARGLPRKDAESLLLQAFLGEAVEGVAHEGAREALVGVVSGWLAGRGSLPSQKGRD